MYVDETGMPLDHRPPKRGHKKVRYRTAGNKSQITVIGCVSATGHAVPPFVIWNAKSMNKEWSAGEVPGTTYRLSSKGWVIRGRQTMKKAVRALTRTTAVCVSGLTKRMWSKTLALIGYSVHARDGSMKSVLIII